VNNSSSQDENDGDRENLEEGFDDINLIEEAVENSNDSEVLLTNSPSNENSNKSSISTTSPPSLFPSSSSNNSTSKDSSLNAAASPISTDKEPTYSSSSFSSTSFSPPSTNSHKLYDIMKNNKELTKKYNQDLRRSNKEWHFNPDIEILPSATKTAEDVDTELNLLYNINSQNNNVIIKQVEQDYDFDRSNNESNDNLFKNINNIGEIIDTNDINDDNNDANNNDDMLMLIENKLYNRNIGIQLFTPNSYERNRKNIKSSSSLPNYRSISGGGTNSSSSSSSSSTSSFNVYKQPSSIYSSSSFTSSLQSRRKGSYMSCFTPSTSLSKQSLKAISRPPLYPIVLNASSLFKMQQTDIMLKKQKSDIEKDEEMKRRWKGRK
jgi:hypothetical protein